MFDTLTPKPVKKVTYIPPENVGEILNEETRYFCPHCWGENGIGVMQQVSYNQISCSACGGLLDWSKFDVEEI